MIYLICVGVNLLFLNCLLILNMKINVADVFRMS